MPDCVEQSEAQNERGRMRVDESELHGLGGS